jgi:MOSC domain-containing protein YiiM
MKLLSINVSLPRLIRIRGQQVETGFFKEPVSGPVAAKTLNLEGDGQADLSVHGGPDKAVYAYPSEHLDYWKKKLGRDDLGPGSFGENLTVEGMSERDVAIGDEFAIGSARFVVTQPRLPCYKLVLAMDTVSIARMFIDSGRTGFYLRVLQEGSIEAGDAINSLPSRESERVTIAEFMDLYRGKRTSLELVRKIQNLAALPADWKESIGRKLEGRSQES